MKKIYKIIGLMSGTSLDGIDICFVSFKKSHKWEFKIQFAETISYNDQWRGALSNAPSLGGDQLLKIDIVYGNYLGEKVLGFIRKYRIKEIDFIASHGHTIFHQPQNNLSFQLGNGQAISNACKLPVISDFRSKDVLLGGQGAPLVPVGDKALFGDFDACLNLGGIANISFDKNGNRIAFDVVPCNMALNEIVKISGLPFDEGGGIARSGSIIPSLLKRLNSLNFYEMPFPKSLGREWYESHFALILGQLKAHQKDILRTLTEHIAMQIRQVVNDHHIRSMLVTGGGAYNNFLIERLNKLSGIDVQVPDSLIVEFKEAMIFAYLGLLRWNSEINVLSSVTGASRDSSSGQINYP